MTTQREIGPYRLKERLGSGGMGEVYRAWDERLDRSVAVKLIRPESADSAVARERFRREARAAAALSHPSVVQIHDIVSTDEAEAIVMELVLGEQLSSRLAIGPLGLGEAVRLGREIAEGLAAAHARGLLHRDLKAENVMITPDGHAKILDFGLAKRLEGEESLTRTAAVVGTFRAMSPEQARGLPLDARSDIFSFGVLLYEMLTGESPFEGSSAPDTLVRICSMRQKPVRELRPEVPVEVSLLVDSLLEKDTQRRLGTAREAADRLASLVGRSGEALSDGQVTLLDTPPATPPRLALRREISWRRWAWPAAAVVGLLALAAIYLPLTSPAEVLYVAVPKPEHTGEGGHLMAYGLRTAVLQSLLALRGVSPLDPQQVDAVSGSAVAIGRAVAATDVLASRLSCGNEVCQVSLDRLRGSDGSLVWTQTFAVPVEQPYLLVEAVDGHLRQAFPDRHRDRRIARLEVRPEDYREYLELYESFDTRREEQFSIAEIRERLGRLRQTSPRFIDALTFESYVLQQQFRSGRDPRDLEEAYALLDQARKLAPEDPRPLIGIFEAFFLGEDLDRAEEALRELDRLQPGDARVMAQRARWLDRSGKPEPALVLMLKAVDRLPSWRHFFWAADMEFRQGKVAAAREHLNELLLRSPGNVIGESLLAQLELFYGDPDRAVELYDGLIQRSPQYSYLNNRGLAHFLQGRFAAAERDFRRALEMRPHNALAALNLADTCLLLGRRSEADELYQETLRLAEEDPTAAANWQLFTTRAQALAHLERGNEAVAAIQEALRLAPANPQAAYEASIVFALLGDRASALFNARRALELGIEPRWFRFPWFDPLRSELDALATSDAT